MPQLRSTCFRVLTLERSRSLVFRCGSFRAGCPTKPLLQPIDQRSSRRRFGVVRFSALARFCGVRADLPSMHFSRFQIYYSDKKSRKDKTLGECAPERD